MTQDHTKNTDTGQEGLFFQLFMAHQRNLYAYILSAVHNYSDADDILQETAAVMWRQFGQFRQGSSFAAWGVGIARFQILKFFNQHKRSRLQFDDELLNQIADLTVEESGRIENLTDALRRCFRRLSEANRKVLDLRYKDGMTIKAIANLTGKPIFAMYKAFSRVQDSLLRCMELTLEKESAG